MKRFRLRPPFALLLCLFALPVRASLFDDVAVEVAKASGKAPPQKKAPAKWPPAPTPPNTGLPVPADPTKPTLTVLAIGVSKYDSPAVNSLQYPAKDATDVANAFKAQEGRLFGHVDITTLTDDKATREGIITSLTTLRMKQATLKANDYTIVFITGHGTTTDSGAYYFAPYDLDLGSLEATGVDRGVFTRSLSVLPGHVLLMVDTAHAAAVNGSIPAHPNAAIQSQSGPPLMILASCDRNERSLESTAWNNGAFVHEFLEGLGGAADANHNNTVTLKELSDYVHGGVLKLTENKQTPCLIVPSGVPDTLPLALTK